MSSALEVIGKKGCEVSESEINAAVAAILLHDIGHGPFSHALEHSIVMNLNHEVLSRLFMDRLNREFKGALDQSIGMFADHYPRAFFHQLISSQLDMDRLDYLNRDSFFTGVTEGVVGAERIIKMLKVHDNQLVVERKGIYSIEKYLISRRLMYWQVYLHKTVLAAEQMLVKTLSRARILAFNGTAMFTTPALQGFLYPGPLSEDPLSDPDLLLESFSNLDDTDIFAVLKVWAEHRDPVLSLLSRGLLNRNLFAVRIRKTPWEEETVEDLRSRVMKIRGMSREESEFLVFTDIIANNAYTDDEDQIQFLDNSGQLLGLTETSDIVNVPLLSRTDSKYILCYPKWLFPREGNNTLS
jgi:HD superfamily phosphohydrolase